jgi:TfoX/Sxy family transcriptional regulator of competence genes
MAYDEGLAERIRAILGHRPGVEERRMFGGLAFMVDGHMTCGVMGEDLMARVGPEGYEGALAEPGARPMDFTGRPLTGMVYVGADGIEDDGALAAWVERTTGFVATLPPKG